MIHGYNRTYLRIDHQAKTAVLTTTQIAATATDTTVLVAPHLVGVCRSDLREIRGERFGRRDFGHEFVGTVVQAPPLLSRLLEQKVVFDPHPRLTRRTSGFAELVELCGTIEQLHAALVPVPSGLEHDLAVIAEPLACAMHCTARLHQVATDWNRDPLSPIAIVGAGMAGTLMSAVLTAQGHPCVLTNPGPRRIEFLCDRAALPPGILRTRNPDQKFDRVILCTATATPTHLQACLRMLTNGGMLLLFAGTQPGMDFHGLDIDQLRRHQLTASVDVTGKRITVAGTYGANREDFTQAFAMLAMPHDASGWSVATCVRRLTTQILPLADAAAFLTASAADGILGKTLVQITPPASLESS